LLLGGAPGCSLILTRGPEVEIQPPPPCTTSNAAPVADTVLAVASAALAGLGVAAATSGSSCSGQGFGGIGCGIGNGVGDIAIAVGAPLTVLFAVSAGFGYNRTSACRASLPPDTILPPTQLTPVPVTSLLPWKAPLGCAAAGDAPRVCATVPSEDYVLASAQ
jgi:hypothetical protein